MLLLLSFLPVLVCFVLCTGLVWFDVVRIVVIVSCLFWLVGVCLCWRGVHCCIAVCVVRDVSVVLYCGVVLLGVDVVDVMLLVVVVRVQWWCWC